MSARGSVRRGEACQVGRALIGNLGSRADRPGSSDRWDIRARVDQANRTPPDFGFAFSPPRDTMTT
jgi:hypothetical protein